MENFWQACSSQLEQELPPQQYSAWIKSLVPLSFEEGKLSIAAPNRFKLDWVKAQFANRITELANQYWDEDVEVVFVLDPRGGKKPAAAELLPGEIRSASGSVFDNSHDSVLRKILKGLYGRRKDTKKNYLTAAKEIDELKHALG